MKDLSSWTWKAMETNCIPHVLCGYKSSNCFHMKIIKIKHVICVAIIWRIFLIINADQNEPFNCSHIFKKFNLICISKKSKSLTIATHIMCLIYMISMHFHIKIVQILLSMQNMWNVITFHCSPSSRYW